MRLKLHCYLQRTFVSLRVVGHNQGFVQDNLVHVIAAIWITYVRVCVKLDGIQQLTERRHCAFIERLLGDCWFSNLLL